MQLPYDLTLFVENFLCSAYDCGRPRHGLGFLCKSHYGRRLRQNREEGHSDQVGRPAKDLVMGLRVIHGMTSTPEHGAWRSMKQRCCDPRSVGYVNYGGRGISICARWQGEQGFHNFFEDMGRRPGAHMSLDRTDNDGNYEPSNCRWATREQQQANRRPTRPRARLHLVCTLVGCSRPFHAKGQCKKHYQQKWRAERAGC